MTRILISGAARVVRIRAWGLFAGMALAWLLACGTAFAQTASATPEPSTQNSVKLSGVIVALPFGEGWASLKFDPFCAYRPRLLTWQRGREADKVSIYFEAFKTEMARAGYKVVTPGEDNLFDPESSSADYQAAAVITDLHIDGCESPGGLFGTFGDVRGEGSMKVDWQLYSPIKKQVVAHVSTSGTAKLDKGVPGGIARLTTESFASNVRELASNTDFRAALSSPKPRTNDILPPDQKSKIALSGSLKAPKHAIADTVSSVVTLLTGSGSGSGILVSDDGYMLTNAHVVGDEKQVRVRWSDGIETVAEVVRVAKDRDVALIKTSSRDRDPLPLKRGPVTPGARVYAIGSPRGKEYQGTVSSGIVSATRVFEGMRYIQSDVAITHGSSGGALLDENGSVIGITVSSVEVQGPVGINFFIPIGDAMDFLSLEQR